MYPGMDSPRLLSTSQPDIKNANFCNSGTFLCGVYEACLIQKAIVQ